MTYKTSTGSWEPLFNTKGNALYPLLIEIAQCAQRQF
jgi:hypothetical protein